VPLLHPRTKTPVELHRRLFKKDIGILSPDALWANKRACRSDHLPGLTAYVLDPTDDLLYCFAHSELKHDCHNKEVIHVRQLTHFSFLCHHHRHDIDWGRVERVANDVEFGSTFRYYLLLAQRFFNISLPFDAEFGAAADGHMENIMATRRGWRKGIKLVRLMIENLQRSFSQEQLRDVYPESRHSVTFLRGKYFFTLLGRYRRFGRWQEMYKRLIPY